MKAHRRHPGGRNSPDDSRKLQLCFLLLKWKMMEKHKKTNPRINLEHSSKKNILFLIFLDSIVMTMKYSVNPQKASTPEGRVGAS